MANSAFASRWLDAARRVGCVSPVLANPRGCPTIRGVRELFLVGPTAAGKSTLAVELAAQCNAEIVNADAFQLYRGLELLSAQPDEKARSRVSHHLFGMVGAGENMSAACYRGLALATMGAICARGKRALIVSGSGLYVRALTHGFDRTAPPNPELRAELSELRHDELVGRLCQLDAEMAGRTDLRNPRRVIRAIEIAQARHALPSEAQGCGRAASKVTQEDPSVSILAARDGGAFAGREKARGVFVLRDRDDLYARINQRVNAMFEAGVEEEVARLGKPGLTAAQALGLREIQQLLAGEISREQCIASIQQKTRRYAKRQLTWFRHQTNFPQLNLTHLSQEEAVSAIVQGFAQG